MQNLRPLWTSWTWMPFVLAAFVVLLGFLVGRFAPHRRRALRRCVMLFLFYIVTIFAVLIAGRIGSARGALWADLVNGTLEYALVANVAAMLLFDFVLPLVGIRFASIVSDLAVGGAYFFGLLVAMQRLGVNPSGIIATSAVVTAVLGLSLQATLGNILGGLALQLDESIRVGDWVELDNKTQGEVREIRWRHTVIETRDWDTLIVPNSSLLAQSFRILGKREGEPRQHRQWVYFGVDFRYHPSEVIAVVSEALRAPIENAATRPAPNCICFELGKDREGSYATYAVRYWLVDLRADDPTNSAVRARIFTALKRANIPLAVPAAAVALTQDDVEHKRRHEERDQAARLAALAHVELFDSMTADEKARLAARVHYAPFARGEIVTRQGATAHWLYVLTKGRAEVRAEADGETRSVATIESPSFFGEMGLMTGAPRSATVAALTDLECYRIEKDDFHGIVVQRPEIAREISQILAERLVSLQAVRENLDAEARRRQTEAERGRILTDIEVFFGLRESHDV